MMVDFGFSLISNNSGFPFEYSLLLLFVIAGFIFYARDVRLGQLLHFTMLGFNFILFFGLDQAGSYGTWDYTPALIAWLMSVVILALSLIVARKSSGQTFA